MFHKIIGFFNRGIAVWVAGFGIVAYLYPKAFTSVGSAINIFFALAMFGIGLVITRENYENILRTPGKILFGVLCQFTIMPLLALVTSRIFNLSDIWTLGLVLTGAAPGAMTSNVISYLSKGDVAYSVSLTAVSTLLCPVLTPLITLWLAGATVPVKFMPMFNTIIWVVVLPLVGGFIFRNYFRQAVNRLKDVPSALSVAAIVVITSYVIAANRDSLGIASVVIILAVAFHNALGMTIGFFAGYLARMNFLKRKTLSIEIGMQNAGLGVVLALQHFGKDVAVPAAIFTVWCIFTASLLVYFWNSIKPSPHEAT